MRKVLGRRRIDAGGERGRSGVMDPPIGRFLSPDPFVQDLEQSQSLNPYSYAWNNPLKYVDPSGYSLKKLFKKFKRALKSALRQIRDFIVDAVVFVAATSVCGGNAECGVAAVNALQRGREIYSIYKRFQSAYPGGTGPPTQGPPSTTRPISSQGQAGYASGQGAHTAPDQLRNRAYTVPENYRSALSTLFGVSPEAIGQIKVTEYSNFARLHGKNTLVTTRVNAIYLRGSGESFISDPDLVLHEYFHVIRQWNTGRLTLSRYAREYLRNGYWDNRFEVEAREFARENLDRFRQLLQPVREESQ